jgi:hypothetical protein
MIDLRKLHAVGGDIYFLLVDCFLHLEIRTASCRLRIVPCRTIPLFMCWLWLWWLGWNGSPLLAFWALASSLLWCWHMISNRSRLQNKKAVRLLTEKV